MLREIGAHQRVGVRMSHPRSAVQGLHPVSDVGGMLFTGRSGEYRAMFALSDDDLTRRVLDCPGGAGSFAAQVNAAGGDVTACDPIYTHIAAKLRDLGVAEAKRSNQYTRDHLDRYV